MQRTVGKSMHSLDDVTCMLIAHRRRHGSMKAVRQLARYGNILAMTTGTTPSSVDAALHDLAMWVVTLWGPKVSLCLCHPWRILVSHSVRNRQIGNGFSIRHMYIRDAVCLFRVSLCMLHAKIWRPREERDTHPRCIEFVIHV